MSINSGYCEKYLPAYLATLSPIVGRKLSHVLTTKKVRYNDGRIYSLADIVNGLAAFGGAVHTRRYSNRKIALEYAELKTPILTYYLYAGGDFAYDCYIPKAVFDFAMYIYAELEADKKIIPIEPVTAGEVYDSIKIEAKHVGLMGRLLGRLDDATLISAMDKLAYLEAVAVRCYSWLDIPIIIEKTALYHCHSDLAISDYLTGDKQGDDYGY